MCRRVAESILAARIAFDFKAETKPRFCRMGTFLPMPPSVSNGGADQGDGEASGIEFSSKAG